LRVPGVTASSSDPSRATPVLKRQVSGTFGSEPTSMPVASSFGASKRCA